MNRFSLFADCLLAGLLVALTTIGVVTAYPGFVAACHSFQDIGGYGRRLRQALPGAPLGLLLILDFTAVATGVPGAIPATVVAAVLLMRAAHLWRPGASWFGLLRLAARESAADPRGTLLLAAAAVAAAGVVVLVPMTAFLIGGVLALATVASCRAVPA